MIARSTQMQTKKDWSYQSGLVPRYVRISVITRNTKCKEKCDHSENSALPGKTELYSKAIFKTCTAKVASMLEL